jgi:hypothetical protein
MVELIYIRSTELSFIVHYYIPMIPEIPGYVPHFFDNRDRPSLACTSRTDRIKEVLLNIGPVLRHPAIEWTVPTYVRLVLYKVIQPIRGLRKRERFSPAIKIS